VGRRIVFNGPKSYDPENSRADVISECNFGNPMNYNPLCVCRPRNNWPVGGGVIDLV